MFTAQYDGRIGEYTTSGTTVNDSLASGVYDPGGLSLSGTDIFVVYDFNNGGNHYGYVGEFTTSGGTVNAYLLSGLNSPTATAVSGTDLFVGDMDDGSIGEFSTSGTTINTSLVSGLSQFNSTFDIAIAPVPEPSSWASILAGGALLACARRFRQVRRT
jgi:hypothetical protein